MKANGDRLVAEMSVAQAEIEAGQAEMTAKMEARYDSLATSLVDVQDTGWTMVTSQARRGWGDQSHRDGCQGNNVRGDK